MNYNGFGQLAQDYQEHNGAVTGRSMLVAYSYVSGTSNTIRRTQLSYPSGYNLNYLYNSGSADDYLSRVGSVFDTDDTTHLADYTYLGASDIVGVDYSGQAAINYNLGSNTGAADPYTGGFDRFDRVILDLWQPDAGGSPLFKLGYTYDLAGNRLTRQDLVAQAQSPPQNFDEAYQYDGLYRLIDFQRGQLSGGAINPNTLNYRQNWQTAPPSSSSSSSSNSGTPALVQLDSLGNWLAFNQGTSDAGFSLTQTRTHNTSNEILSITGGGWTTPSYDNAGNTTSFPQPSGPTSGQTATYDAWNRLISISGEITHAYDGLNRMVQYGLGDIAIDLYYSDQWQLLEIWAGTPPTIAERFVWGLRYVDDLVLRDSSTSGDGTLDQRIYSLQDAHWSVVALFDPSVPGIVERHAFDAYGNPFFLNPDFSEGSNSYTWVFLYSGYFWDPVVGLYYVRNRVYHALLGRWLQRDPIGYNAGDRNLYAYVANNATNWSDPSGLACCGSATYNPATQCCIGGIAVSLTLVCVRCEQSHAWVYTRDLLTGTEHSYGRFAAGYGGATCPGVQTDLEQSAGRSFEVERCVKKCGFTPTLGSGYSWYGNNCASYGRDVWQATSGEYLNATTWWSGDYPSNLCQSIRNANGGKSTNYEQGQVGATGGGSSGSSGASSGSLSGSASSCKAPSSHSCGSGWSGQLSGSSGSWW